MNTAASVLKRAALGLVCSLLATAGCGGGFPHFASQHQLVVTLEPGTNVGTPDARLPLSFTNPENFAIRVEAHLPDGSLDTSFNGFVRLSIKPGTVVSVTGTGAQGRNVQLTKGVADGVTVGAAAAYGDARIWAEDIGYVPADPARMPPPQCSDGIDNNHNGLVDFPVDPGCAFANDDTEDGGSYASGATVPLYFVFPRIADIRGVSQGGGATPFPHEQILVDTQWNGSTAATPAGIVVTRVSSDGFYVTDLGETRGYSSLFAYNYVSPPRMRVCDRLVSLGGTASDFFGFTELGFPTWIIEEWDPAARPCLVPEPHVFSVGELGSTAVRLNVEASLVRVMRGSDAPCMPGQPGNCTTVHISSHFGPAFMPKDPMTGAYTPMADATDCDFNRDGKITFDGGPENQCSDACTMDVECTEYSGYAGFSQFNLVLVDTSKGFKGTILANGSTDPTFNPLISKGQDISAFTGTLRYFSGGTQFTIEARCQDDIVMDITKPPLPSSPPWPPAPGTIGDQGAACVSARTISDINQY